MRIRSVRPEFFDSESIGRLCPHARLLFIGLWMMADDSGRMKFCPQLIRARLFAFDNVTDEDLAGWVEELESGDMVQLYEVGGEEFLSVVNFGEYQHPNRPTPSKLPTPPARTVKQKAPSVKPPPQPVVVAMEGSEPFKLAAENPPAPKRFTPPTEEEVRGWCLRDSVPETEAVKFIAHHKTRGWRLKTGPMKDAEAAWVTWRENHREWSGVSPNGNGSPQSVVKQAHPTIRLKALGEQAADLGDRIRLCQSAEERAALISQRSAITREIAAVRAQIGGVS